jgi:ketosteroid isomerase-like protein
MPEEPTTPDLVELTRLAEAAFNRKEFAAYASPDMVLDTAGYGMGTFHGREAAMGFLKDWTSSFEDLTAESDEILDLGHGVILNVYHQEGRPIGASNYVRVRSAMVMLWVDGVIVRNTIYPETDIDEARADAERLAQERGKAVSQENVKLVKGTPVLDGDWVPLFRNDDNWAVVAEALAPYYHEDVECRATRFDAERTYKGLEGLRAIWLDWLAPWTSYRVEAHDPIDLGDRVVLPTFNFGCLHGSTEEIRMDAAAVFTLCEGKIARVEFYAERSQALKAVGLQE